MDLNLFPGKEWVRERQTWQELYALSLPIDQFRSIQISSDCIYKKYLQKNKKYTILPAHDKPTAWLH